MKDEGKGERVRGNGLSGREEGRRAWLHSFQGLGVDPNHILPSNDPESKRSVQGLAVQCTALTSKEQVYMKNEKSIMDKFCIGGLTCDDVERYLSFLADPVYVCLWGSRRGASRDCL